MGLLPSRSQRPRRRHGFRSSSPRWRGQVSAGGENEPHNQPGHDRRAGRLPGDQGEDEQGQQGRGEGAGQQPQGPAVPDPGRDQQQPRPQPAAGPPVGGDSGAGT